MPAFFVQYDYTTSERILPQLCGMITSTTLTSEMASGSMAWAWPATLCFNLQRAAGVLVGTVGQIIHCAIDKGPKRRSSFFAAQVTFKPVWPAWKERT